MKLALKNFANDVFRMVTILHICSAVRGQINGTTLAQAPTTSAVTTQKSTTASTRTPTTVTIRASSSFQTTDQASSKRPQISNTATKLTVPTTSEKGISTTKADDRSSTTLKVVTNGEKTTSNTTNQTPVMSSLASDVSQNSPKSSSPAVGPKDTSPTPMKDNTSMIVIIIVAVAAIIVIFIAIVTAVCLCYCKSDRGEPKGYSSPESHGSSGVKGKPSNGHRHIDDMDGYDIVNEREQVFSDSVSSNDKPLANRNYYSNKGLIDEDAKTYVNTATTNERSPLAEKSKSNTENIFEGIDPTTDKVTEQIELSSSESPTSGSNSEEERAVEGTKLAKGEPTDKGREAVVTPTPVVRKNISNKNDNVGKLTKTPTPQPRARPVSRVPQDDEGTAKDNIRNEPSSDAESPSPTIHQEKHRMFRPPSKGKGPDGSDQAALLANVLRKSNAPRQIEEEEAVDEGDKTTYW